jgi:hypothetical protein
MVPLPPPLQLAADLAPVDSESFRSRYDQEALFRFDPGVEAAPPGSLWHPRHGLGQIPGAGDL